MLAFRRVFRCPAGSFSAESAGGLFKCADACAAAGEYLLRAANEETGGTHGVCRRCHASCASCSGGAAEDCTACVAGFIFAPGLAAAGSCTAGATCDAGRYLDAGVCSSCNSSCSTCTGGPTRCQAFPPTVTGCTECAAGYTLKSMQIYGSAEPCLNADGNNAGAQCVADCALLPGTFLAADGTCTACDAECASCQWPGTAAACLSCPAAAPHLVTAAGAVAAAGIAGYCEARWGTLELRLSSLTTNRGAWALRARCRPTTDTLSNSCPEGCY